MFRLLSRRLSFAAARTNNNDRIIASGGRFLISSEQSVFTTACAAVSSSFLWRKRFSTDDRRRRTTTTSNVTTTLSRRRDPKNKNNNNNSPASSSFFQHVQLNREIVACVTCSEILKHVETNSEKYNGVNVSTAWHRLAKKLGREERSSVREFKRDARVLLLEEATVRCMQGLFRGNEDGDVTSRETAERRHERRQYSSRMKAEDAFDAQNVGNILWACATILYTPRLGILDKFADIIEGNVDKLYPQALSNSLWSFARLKEWNLLRCKTVAELLMQQALRMLPEVLEDVKKAGGMFEAKDVPFGGFSTQAIGNAMWSCGTLRCHPGEKIMDAYLKLTTEYHEKFKTQEISNIAWASAMLQHHPGDAFLSVVSETLAKRLEECASQAVSNSLLGLATFGYKMDEEMLKALGGKRHARRCNSQDLCNSIWALAAVDAFEAEVYGDLWSRVSSMHHDEFAPEGLNMLYHACVMHQDHWMDQHAVGNDDVVDEEVLEDVTNTSKKRKSTKQSTTTTKSTKAKGFSSSLHGAGVREVALQRHDTPIWLDTIAKKSYDDQTIHSVTLSAFHKHVSTRIRAGFIKNVADEYLTEDGVMSIDIALLDHKIAIECDGPSHFEKNMEKSMTHKTIIRNRGLERRGWRVVSIPYFEWQEANANETHRKYLEDKLASVGVQREQVLTLF